MQRKRLGAVPVLLVAAGVGVGGVHQAAVLVLSVGHACNSKTIAIASKKGLNILVQVSSANVSSVIMIHDSFISMKKSATMQCNDNARVCLSWI